MQTPQNNDSVKLEIVYILLEYSMYIALINLLLWWAICAGLCLDMSNV